MEVWLIISVIVFGLVLGCVVGMTSIGKGLIGTPGLIFLGIANPVGTIAVSGVLMMFSSTIKHYKNKNIHMRTAWIFSATAVPLSFLFSRWAGAINNVVPVTYIIAGAIVLSVITLVYKFFISKNTNDSDEFKDPGIVFPLILGAILSFFIGVTGISGSLIVIAFMMVLKMPERLAIGTTNFVAIFALIAAASGYISKGQVNWMVVIEFAPAVMVGAYLGANLTNVVPKKPLQVIILSLLFVAAIGILFVKKGARKKGTTGKSLTTQTIEAPYTRERSSQVQ